MKLQTESGRPETSPPSPLSINGEGEQDEQQPITGGAPVSPEARDFARGLRAESTQAEEAAWEILRDRQILNLKFRRQQPIAGFVVDFFCAERRLAIELDGGVHDGIDAKARDAERDAQLSTQGIQVLRVRNEDVSPQAFKTLLTKLSPVPSPPSSPSPFMERGPGGEVA
jgi:very-short-patch-repair endonuclease